MTAARGWQTALFAGAAAACIAAVALAAPDRATQALWLAPAVAILGLPHGAFDLTLAERIWRLRGAPGVLAFLLAYLALAGAVLALWLAAPGAALVAFLAYSGWHFAADWDDEGPAWRIAGGLGTLGAPALASPGEVAAIFAILAGPEAGDLAARGLAVAGAAGLGAGLFAALTRPARLAGIEIAALWGAAVLLPPLVYFVAYFCFLHSPRHLTDVLAGLAERRRAFAQAGAITAVTLTGAGAALLWLDAHGPPDEAILQVVFVGLAALTVPHMLLVDRWARSPTPLRGHSPSART